MVRVIYVEQDGTEHKAVLDPGMSVMEGALHNDIPGIDADCGGACACATCHVFVAPEWLDQVGPQSGLAAALLEMAPEVRPNSRLSCQIKVTAAMDGLIVTTPKSQR